jgi:hypothetical protein
VQDLSLNINNKTLYIETNLAQEFKVKINNKNMEKVGNKMAKEWTLQNAVKKFKPEKMKSLKRNKGNLNKREFESLIKEMKCYYEIVKEIGEGKGRDRIIFTDKKRKEKVKKEDKRQFNKGIAPPHSKHLALMVMSKMDNIDNKARTRNGWATYFGLISPAEQDIMRGIYSGEALRPYKTSMIKLGILEDGEEEVFQDLANTLKNVARGQLQTVLKQAEGLELISRKSSWKGKVKGSREPIDIDKNIAGEINFVEAELLDKHEISKRYSLMFKNSLKTKAFKAEWLEYIENVEDVEGDAMHLQYIYEVFRIEVLNENAFDEFIKAHYPSEIDSFNLLENEQVYHSKLIDYVVANAQKKHENYMKKKHDKVVQSEEGLKGFCIGVGMSEEEAVEYSKQSREEDAYIKEIESSLYMDLLESDRYVDCMGKLHIQLHGINPSESEKIKKVQQINDEHERVEFARLGLSDHRKEESEKSILNGIYNYDESSVNTKYHEELDKQYQANQAAKETVLENLEHQGKIIVAKPNVESYKHCDAEDEYEAAMADIRDEIRQYEEKYGDKAMERIALDRVIRELTREVTLKEVIDEIKHQWECEKERKRKEWDKLFEGEKPVKWEQTTNNPLEVFQSIRYGRIE